jgi:ribosomal protein S18 acetylase RimI-like enzyme
LSGERQAPDVTVRPATPADVPAIGRMGALLVRGHHDFDPKRFIPAPPETERGYGSFLASQLEKSDALVLVAEEDEEVVGYTFSALEGKDYLSLRGPAGVLHDIVVDPRAQGRGVGRALLEGTLDALAARGATQVVLFTAHGNATAQRLFGRRGFRPTMIEMTLEMER